jgi:hypothetical protein
MYTGGQMLETYPENCHFVPLSGTAGMTSRRQKQIRKSLHDKLMGTGSWGSWTIIGASGMKCPKTATVIASDVHYLKPIYSVALSLPSR